ncbi:MAG TPA: hypothetical protein VGI75_14690 [Pirellulales bacterium]
MGAARLAALMAVALVGLWIVSLPVAISLSGQNGFNAGLLAAVVVWFASAAGMAIGECFYGRHEAILKLLFGMSIRMLIPLVGCLIVLMASPRLAGAGFVFYVLAFYLAALPIETFISLARTAAPLAAGNVVE